MSVEDGGSNSDYEYCLVVQPKCTLQTVRGRDTALLSAHVLRLCILRATAYFVRLFKCVRAERSVAGPHSKNRAPESCHDTGQSRTTSLHFGRTAIHFGCTTSILPAARFEQRRTRAHSQSSVLQLGRIKTKGPFAGSNGDSATAPALYHYTMLSR